MAVRMMTRGIATMLTSCQLRICWGSGRVRKGGRGTPTAYSTPNTPPRPANHQESRGLDDLSRTNKKCISASVHFTCQGTSSTRL
jgi:hypothetical protein